MTPRPLPAGATPFERLVDLMATLRGDGGCPWDREQTHLTLTPYLIEEAYEVLECIEDGDMGKLREELGDLLLQVVFHAQLAREVGRFDIDDVSGGIVEKMVRRHPHVFGDSVANTAGEVLAQWEQLKQREKGENKKTRPSLMDGIPRQMPALLAAERISARASEVGFRWDEAETALEKICEESREALEAWRSGDHERAREEMGDVLFATSNLCRMMKIISEDALRRTNAKFIARFGYIEAEAERRGIGVKDMQRDEMLRLWEESKSRAGKERGAEPFL